MGPCTLLFSTKTFPRSVKSSPNCPIGSYSPLPKDTPSSWNFLPTPIMPLSDWQHSPSLHLINLQAATWDMQKRKLFLHQKITQVMYKLKWPIIILISCVVPPPGSISHPAHLRCHHSARCWSHRYVNPIGLLKTTLNSKYHNLWCTDYQDEDYYN